jgi:hypothetical protein
MMVEVLFDRPQCAVAARINEKLKRCESAQIVAGFLTPSGVRAIAQPIRARPQLLRGLVVGAATYPGFQALDELISMGVPADRIHVHLGHTRESGTQKHPIVRHHPMLHSKIYYLEMPNEDACAFVGSHNVTSFALEGLNGEAAVLLEGKRGLSEFDKIRQHIQTATSQAIRYSPAMKEAFAWWTREFLDGLRTEVDLPKDATTVRTILIFASASTSDRPARGDHFYFELPMGIEQIESLKTEVHLFLFSSLPSTPSEALQRITTADARYTCKVLGAENLRANLELKMNWRVEVAPTPILKRVPSGILRPSPASGMQQVHAQVDVPTVKPYEYLFEKEKASWWPILTDRAELHAEYASEEDFPIQDVRWQRADSNTGWKLVTGLKQGEGPTLDKDALALELVRPESGSFVLVSVRRRAITVNRGSRIEKTPNR